MQHGEGEGGHYIKKRREIRTEKVTHKRSKIIGKYTVMKQQQQGISVTNSDIVNPAKPFIPDKYNNRMNLKKLKRIKYFTKALLELIARVFSEEEVRICANITASVEKLIVWHKALPTYR